MNQSPDPGPATDHPSHPAGIAPTRADPDFRSPGPVLESKTVILVLHLGAMLKKGDVICLELFGDSPVSSTGTGESSKDLFLLSVYIFFRVSKSCEPSLFSRLSHVGRCFTFDQVGPGDLGSRWWAFVGGFGGGMVGA